MNDQAATLKAFLAMDNAGRDRMLESARGLRGGETMPATAGTGGSVFNATLFGPRVTETIRTAYLDWYAGIPEGEQQAVDAHVHEIKSEGDALNFISLPADARVAYATRHSAAGKSVAAAQAVAKGASRAAEWFRSH